MYTYKKIDYIAQLMLVLFFAMYALFISTDLFFWGYFIVGGWQMLSCGIHACFRRYYQPVRDRSTYLCVVAAFAALTLAGIAGPSSGLLALSLYTLLFVSPFLAAWYISICIRESRYLANRQLVHLK